MNKVIEECAEKARFYSKRKQLVDADFLEFFAELIMLECVNICQTNAKEHSDKNRGIWHDPTEQLVSNKLAHRIMDHFGD